jgi:hypothetical protein
MIELSGGEVEVHEDSVEGGQGNGNSASSLPRGITGAEIPFAHPPAHSSSAYN